MTQRKPPAARWDSWVDQAIRRAQDEGQFDDLPGKGKPLAQLDRVYDPDWWAKDLIQREKISLLPPALSIRRKVEQELPRIAALVRESDVRLALEQLNEEIRRVNRTAVEGPATGLGGIDVDTFVTRWQAQREDSG